MLEAYRKHVAERAQQNIPPKPLNAEQVAGLVELLKAPPAGEEATLLDLISNRVRMPVFGRSVKPIERTEESISRKGYLLMKDSEIYTSSRVFTNQVFGVSNALQHKYVLDPVAFVVISQQENAQLLMQQQVDPALFSKGQPPTLPQTQGGVENTIDSVEMQGSQTQEMAR